MLDDTVERTRGRKGRSRRLRKRGETRFSENQKEDGA